MWRKLAAPEFFASMRRLTPDQRWAIQQVVARLERDPSDAVWSPVILDANTREIFVDGLWLRYRLVNREILFLQVSV